MTTPQSESALPVERRQRHERRDRPTESRRGKRTRASWARVIGGYLFGIVTLVVTILFAVMHTRPIFAGHQTVTEQLVARGQEAAKVAQVRGDFPGGPTDTLSRDSNFVRDQKAFADDMRRHGHIDSLRADTVAYYAVREAYAHKIPPALIFGVMLTENSRFVSNARSNVGAQGLMQIYGKVWLKPLGKKFGTDLASDSTNMKYGAFILREYLKPKKGQAPSVATIRKGLLNYNGCVRGTNTPRCHTYPSKIEGYVEREAKSLCGGRTFNECITQPFVRGLLGERTAVASVD